MNVERYKQSLSVVVKKYLLYSNKIFYDNIKMEVNVVMENIIASLFDFQSHKFSIFEIGMLFCFGISWPFAVAKTYKTKNVEGKSIVFLNFVIIGYALGIIHKLLYNLDIVILLYVLNEILVLMDLFLWFRYRKV